MTITILPLSFCKHMLRRHQVHRDKGRKKMILRDNSTDSQN